MNEVPLSARKRQGTGKQIVKALRRQGKLPAVIYGGNQAPEPLELDYREFDAFMRKYHGENVIINLKIGSRAKPRMAILRDIQQDFLRDQPLHVDFQQISMTDRVTATVPIVLTGEAEGTQAEFGGILDQALREFMIQCIVSDMPEHLEVDVSTLNIGDSIHVRDLSFPAIDIMTDGDAVVATVVAPMREEEIEEEVEEELEEPEVIGREKEEAEGAEESEES